MELRFKPRSPDPSSQSFQYLKELSDIGDSPVLLASPIWDAPVGSHRLALALLRVGQLILRLATRGRCSHIQGPPQRPEGNLEAGHLVGRAPS